MTDRDRLINELKKAKNRCLIKSGGGCLACTYRGKADCTLENIADYLLANGVIVQKQGEWQVHQMTSIGIMIVLSAMMDMRQKDKIKHHLIIAEIVEQN